LLNAILTLGALAALTILILAPLASILDHVTTGRRGRRPLI